VLTRRRLLPWLVALGLLTLAVHALSTCPRSLVATVRHIADGDTLPSLISDGTKLRIRLLGIDPPEIANGAKLGPLSGSLHHQEGVGRVTFEVMPLTVLCEGC
jgi:hypothetical protein